MDLQHHKEIVRRFIETYSCSDVAETAAQMTDSATFSTMIVSEDLPITPHLNKAEFCQMLSGMGTAFPNGCKMVVTGLVAEGNRVAAEAESVAEMRDGTVYHNRYHFLLEVEDGKISSVREYCDFLHAKEAVFKNSSVQL